MSRYTLTLKQPMLVNDDALSPDEEDTVILMAAYSLYKRLRDGDPVDIAIQRGDSDTVHATVALRDLDALETMYQQLNIHPVGMRTH